MSKQPLGPALPGMRCVQHLGSGGYSDVYLYERDQPRIKVAVKLLKPDGLGEAQLRQFAAEAEVMAELAEHPYIVAVMGAGTAGDGRPYLEMAYYPPPDLGKRVAENPLGVADALRTGVQLASAVETAHRSGVIHRDIKPENILMTSYSIPGLTDFGIAGRGDREDDDEVGVSVPWAPPEVLTGQSNGSPASDVYSLAATLWNLLVGRSPFSIEGDNGKSAMFRRILHSRPPATGIADVPASLERLLQQAMAKDPAQRPQTALELARSLRRIEQELGLTQTEIFLLEADPVPVPTLEATPSVLDDTATVRRPKRASTPLPMVEERLDDGVTIRRPARAVVPGPDKTFVPPRPTEPEAEPAAVTSPALLVALIAALLVVAVGGGIYFVSRGGDTETPSTMPSSSRSVSLDDVVDLAPVAPEVEARAGAGDATFKARREQPGDVFTWEVSQPGQPYAAFPKGDNREAIVIRVEGSGRVCARLLVRRAGQISDPAEACATAP